MTLESLTMGLPSETVSKPRLERKYAFLTAPSEKPAYSSCRSLLMTRSSSTCEAEADGALAGAAAVGAGVGAGAGVTGAGVGFGSGAGCVATGSGVTGFGSATTGFGSGTTGFGSGATGLGSGAAGFGSGAGVATTGFGSGAGAATTGLGVMVGAVGLESGVGVGFSTVVVGAGFGVAGVVLGFGAAGAGLAATTAGFGVGLGVATGFGAGTGAGLGAMGAVIRCCDCVRKIGEATESAPAGLNVVVGRMVWPAKGTAGLAARIATGTGRGRLGAPGSTGGNGWARGTTMVCVVLGGWATTVGVVRTGAALIVGVGAGAALTAMLLGGRCKLEPFVDARGNGANGLSARGAAAGRGLVWAVCALVLADLLVTGFTVFEVGFAAGFAGFFKSGTLLP
jgi:hypothetical protein